MLIILILSYTSCVGLVNLEYNKEYCLLHFFLGKVAFISSDKGSSSSSLKGYKRTKGIREVLIIEVRLKEFTSKGRFALKVVLSLCFFSS